MCLLPTVRGLVVRPGFFLPFGELGTVPSGKHAQPSCSVLYDEKRGKWTSQGVLLPITEKDIKSHFLEVVADRKETLLDSVK